MVKLETVQDLTENKFAVFLNMTNKEYGQMDTFEKKTDFIFMKEFDTELQVLDFLHKYKDIITTMLENGDWENHVKTLPLKNGVLQGKCWVF